MIPSVIFQCISCLIPLGFFQSVDFFVMAAVAAAAVVAYMCLPQSRGEAVTYTVGGRLGNIEGPEQPKPGSDDDSHAGWLLVECRNDGTVTITRTGIRGITESGAVSIASTVTGFDLSVQERRSRGWSSDPLCSSATFTLDFLAPDWYHVRYGSDEDGVFCAFQLHVKPGLVKRVALR